MSMQEAPVGYSAGTSFKWNTRGQTIAAATVLPALGIIGVALRFWSRFHKRTGFGLDDAFILPALLCVIGLGITLLIGVADKVVAHTTPPDPNAGNPDAQLYQISTEQVIISKIGFAFFLLTVVAYGFIKLSILFFYRRLFVKGTYTKFDIATKFAIAITSAWTIVFFLLQLFLCGRHIDANWGPLIDLTRCLNSYQYNDGLFISDLITDLLVICLPIPLILQLHMTMQRKLATIGVLLLGTISIVASLIRIVFNYQTQAAGFTTPTDVDEEVTTLLYWGMLEAGISLIASNLPSIYFLIRKESLQSFADSVRTQVSLTSLRSQQSKNETGDESLHSKQRSGSMASHVPGAGRDGAEQMPAFPMYGMGRTTEISEPTVAHVTGGMKHQENMV